MFPWWYRLLGVDLIIGSKMNEIASLKNLLEYNCELLKIANDEHKEALQQKDEEIRRLTDLMLVEHGVISREPDARTTQPSKPQPIGRRASFRTIRNKFEAADAKMAQEIAKDQVERLSDYWTKKNQEAAKEA